MSRRVLSLEGGRNFRDLGGYCSRYGGTVRWGQVFRSGALCGLPEQDGAVLAALGVAVVFDLRSLEERDSEPTVWTPGPGPKFRTFDYLNADVARATNLRAALELDADAVRASMSDIYAGLPYVHVEKYRALFADLLAGRLPLVFHCSAGKDRTGVAAALVLTALGVSDGDIMDDYVMSDRILDGHALVEGPQATDLSTGFAGVGRYPPHLRAPLLRSDPQYLKAALASIEQRDGSVDDYLRTRLGIGPDEKRALRARLLEPHQHGAKTRNHDVIKERQA